MINALTPFKDGTWVRSGLIMVHSGMGWVIRSDNHQPIDVFRHQIFGTIFGQLPEKHGVTEVGRSRLLQLDKIILAVLQGGMPSGWPLVIPVDGNKWNPQPSNLRWISRKEHAYRRVMDNNVPLKLNGHISLTLRDVVTRLGLEGIKDYDAIGSTFRVGGRWVKDVVDRKAWYYAEEFINSVTTKASDYQIHKAREAAAVYAVRDEDLKSYMAQAVIG